jgi:hypothetical protein
LGINPQTDSWFAWQVRSAVFRFGTWFEARQQETKEVDMPEHRGKPKRLVPKYSESDLAAMLGLTGADGGARELTTPDTDKDRQAAELMAALHSGQPIDWHALGFVP